MCMSNKSAYFYYFSLFLFLILLTNCQKNKEVSSSEILWDTWGIPHIYALDNYELYKMAGWSQMHNHGNLILRLYGESRGKSAEYWGTDFSRDERLHQLGLIAGSKALYPKLSVEEKEILQAFTDGINAYATKHPLEVEAKFKVVLPVLPEDVLLHASRVFYYEFLVHRALKKEKQFTVGSNAWAVSGNKTQSGNTMLLANPHLPWYDFWLFFECQYITPQNNLYGVTLVGLPNIGIGFNQSLGWTHTVNTIDNVDFYELDIRNGQYKLDGQYHDFQIDTIALKVKTEKGLIPKNIIRKKSIHGTVISEKDGKTIALRSANMDQPLNVIRQWNEMGKAKSLSEFEAAIKINTLPLYNIIYADVAGNILYQMGGQIPKKNGDWNKWQGLVSGNSKEDIWTDYYECENLPHTLNPPTGWLQNCNDSPYTNTLPTQINPSDFSSHISPNRMSFRAQRSVNLINESTPIDLEQFIALKHNTQSELALRLKDDIEKLKAHTKDSLTLQAIEVLHKWDASFEEKSQGAVLFTNFVNQLGGKALDKIFEEEWSFQKPVETPDGFKNTEYVLLALKEAAEQQMKYFGSLEVDYGKVFRVKVGANEYPANGGFGHLGLFRTVSFKPKKDGKYYAFHGDGFVSATEFGQTIKSKAILTYGNASQANNSHIGDQLELFYQKKLRPVWLKREEQQSNQELRESIDDMAGE